MTLIQYAIARRVHVLEEAGKRRKLTDEEREFLKRTAGVLRRLAEREQKSMSRSGA